MKQLFLVTYIGAITGLLTSPLCNKPPYKTTYINIGGYVIGKEYCYLDDIKDNWLLDLTVYSNSQKIGDTLTLNGITYTNVVKVKGLEQRLKQIGMRVSIDYKSISKSVIMVTYCDVATSVTYALKEIYIH